MLTITEVRQLAFELARDRAEADCNQAYHNHIHSWGRARGGVQIGAWDAWKDGWQAGLKIKWRAIQ
jgi:hypothetical protein